MSDMCEIDEINGQFDEFQEDLEIRDQHFKLLSKTNTDEVMDIVTNLFLE